VYEKISSLGFLSFHLAQKIPEGVIRFLVMLIGVELITSPVDRATRFGVEILSVKKHRLLVISQQAETNLATQLDTLPRIGTVTDHITETVNRIDASLLDVGQDNLQGLVVGMNVGHDGNGQGNILF
jgi:hypothetical protein